MVMSLVVVIFNPHCEAEGVIIRMLFVCLSVRPSVHNTIVSAPYLLNSLKDFHYFGRMFNSVRRCAEPITQPCSFKVKVTIQGHKLSLVRSIQLFIGTHTHGI